MRLPLVLFLVGLAVFAAFAGQRLRIHSADNHFVYLADAFLHGQVELTRRPHHQNDWASYDVVQLQGASKEAYGPEVRGFFTRRSGKPDEFRRLDGTEINVPTADRGASDRRYFVSFPPFPAVLLMPVVALTGYGANDVVFTIVFAALNFLLTFLLLERLRERSGRTRTENVWLSVLFAFGSVHLWSSIFGTVWFSALIIGATFNLLYIYFAIDARRPLLAGLCLAAGFATRTPLLFASVFFLTQVLWPSGGPLPRGEVVRRLAWFAAPCVGAGLLLLWYNQARFENPLEFGHTYLATGGIERIRDFGLFNTAFLSRNLHAALTLLPRIGPDAPYVKLSNHGMSLLLTTPALLLLLWPRHPSQSARSLARALGITAAVVAVPILFYQNTGWIQFGYRFSIDFMPYLVCCLALGARPLTRGFKALIIAGVLVNAFGAVTFKRMNHLYGDFMCEEPRR